MTNELKYSCPTHGRYMDKPCSCWSNWIANPEPSDNIGYCMPVIPAVDQFRFFWPDRANTSCGWICVWENVGGSKVAHALEYVYLEELVLANLKKQAERNQEAIIAAREHLVALPPPKPKLPVGVSVLITSGTKVLMGLRTNNTASGLLSTPGGRIEENEDMFACAIRETEEETGLKLPREALEVIAWREHFRYGGHYIMFYVHATRFSGFAKNLEPEKCASWDWHEIDEIKEGSTTEPIDVLALLKPETNKSPELELLLNEAYSHAGAHRVASCQECINKALQLLPGKIRT